MGLMKTPSILETKMTDQVNYHRLTNDRQYMSTGLKSVSEALVCVVYTLTVSPFLERGDVDAAETPWCFIVQVKWKSLSVMKVFCLSPHLLHRNK